MANHRLDVAAVHRRLSQSRENSAKLHTAIYGGLPSQIRSPSARNRSFVTVLLDIERVLARKSAKVAPSVAQLLKKATEAERSARTQQELFKLSDVLRVVRASNQALVKNKPEVVAAVHEYANLERISDSALELCGFPARSEVPAKSKPMAAENAAADSGA